MGVRRFGAVVLFIFLSSSIFYVQAQTQINLSGTVIDSTTSKAVVGATITLKKITGLSAKTDTQGKWSIVQTAINPQNLVIDLESSIFMNDNILVLNQQAGGEVSIVLYNMKGANIQSLYNGLLAAGSHVFTIPANLASSIALIGITQNNHTQYIKAFSGTGYCANLSNGFSQSSSFATAQYAAVDTVIVTMTNYVVKKQPIDTYSNNTLSTKLAPVVTIKYPIQSGSCRYCSRFNSCKASCAYSAVYASSNRILWDKTKCKGVLDATCKGKCTTIVCFLRKPAFVEALEAYFTK